MWWGKVPGLLSRGFISLSFFLLFVAPVTAGSLQSSTEIRIKINQAAVQSQEKVDRLAEETDKLLREYRSVLRQTESLRIYNDQLERLLRSQEGERTSLKTQLEEIEVTHREIFPLILRMIESLRQFVELDRPFLLEERRARVAALRELMDQPDVTIAGKYRRVMEAYQVEVEYGRTVEAYEGVLEKDGSDRTVHFLRVGRILLAYLSLDGKEAGYWNQEQKRWKRLPDGDRSSIMRGIRIAKKEIPSDLIRLPVRAPESLK